MGLFKINQLCILHIQIVINSLCLLVFILFLYVNTLQHKHITSEVN